MSMLTTLLQRKTANTPPRRTAPARATAGTPALPLSAFFEERPVPSFAVPQEEWAETGWGWHDSSQTLRDGLQVSEHDDETLFVEFV